MVSTMVHAKNRECVEACSECAQACENCNYQCCAGDSGPMAVCGRLFLDCAAVCRLCVDLLSRGSTMSAKICELCISICEACAAECAGQSAEPCQQCAEACRTCIRACQQYLAAV